MKVGTVCYVVNMAPGAPELAGRVVTITAHRKGVYTFTPPIEWRGVTVNLSERENLLPISDPDEPVATEVGKLVPSAA